MTSRKKNTDFLRCLSKKQPVRKEEKHRICRTVSKEREPCRRNEANLMRNMEIFRLIFLRQKRKSSLLGCFFDSDFIQKVSLRARWLSADR